MLAEVTLEGLTEEEFRQSIEVMLREGAADEAARRIRKLLDPHCGRGRPLPANFMDLSPADVVLSGWNDLHTAMDAIDEQGEDVTAISFDIALPRAEDWQADAEGNPMAEPRLLARFYTDAAFAFSTASMADLAAAYEGERAPWHGLHHEDGDEETLRLSGLADVNGALVDLGESLASGRANGEEHHAAYVLGSCYLAVLIHRALRDMALGYGLPRPIAMLVSHDDAFPRLDAPVLAAMADAPESDDFLLSLQFAKVPDAGDDNEAYDEEDAGEGMALLLDMQVEAGNEPLEGDDPEAWHLPPPGIHVTGTQLRRRLVTEESLMEFGLTDKPSLIGRLFGRFKS